jgi:ubiquinone/menaquinone biosynthesis C-methylase UbiE
MVGRLPGAPGSDEYHAAYAQFQFDRKVRLGLGIQVTGLSVLEIGCGHGGITTFLGAAGARRVVGVDLNTRHLAFARQVQRTHAARIGSAGLPVSFVETDARQLSFPDASFDLVVADNVFEHFMDPAAVLRESCRVLRPGGHLIVPLFSSIYSKQGLHLKHGLKVPWANLVFSETTILRALQRLAAERPELYDIYPGLRAQPTRVRDVRRYGDLNDLTYGRFRQLAQQAGFTIQWFRPQPTKWGHVIGRVPWLRHTRLMDVLSTGAGALLVKRT